MTKKRNKLEVIRDILKVIRDKHGKIKPTHIMYKSNLSHHMMEEYLKELKEKGFILESNDEKHRTYSITKKGLEYLEKFKFIINFTDSFGLNF
jgi:predicted transcriptional regulator